MSAQGIREDEDADADVGLDDAVGCDPHPIDTNRPNAATTNPLRIPEPLEGGRSAGSKACGQAEVAVRVGVGVLALDRHRELEAVGGESEVEVRGRKAGPLSTDRPPVAIAVTKGTQP